MNTFKFKNGKFVISEGYGSMKKMKEAETETPAAPAKEPQTAGDVLKSVDLDPNELAGTIKSWAISQKINLPGKNLQVSEPDSGKTAGSDTSGAPSHSATPATGDRDQTMEIDPRDIEDLTSSPLKQVSPVKPVHSASGDIDPKTGNFIGTPDPKLAAKYAKPAAADTTVADETEVSEEELQESKKYINPRKVRKTVRHSSLIPYRR
jgi:hypothetical protein